MCRTESASSNTEPIVLTDVGFIDVYGGVSLSLSEQGTTKLRKSS